MKKILRKGKFLLLLPMVFALTSCNIQDAFNGVEEKLWPNVWVTLAQVIAFVVMALLVFFIAYKPIRKNLDARRNKVAKTIRDAEDKLEQANLEKLETEKNLKASHQEGEKIIEDSRKIAEIEANKIILDAENQASKRMEQADKQIKLERIKMEQEIKKEIIENALEASKEILQRELNNKDNDKIIEDFIKKSKK